jgi:hypothetical protein
MVSVADAEGNVVAAWAVTPMKGVTVYPVTGSPPVDEGGLQLNETEASPDRPDTAEGEEGAVAGVTGDDGAEGTLVPALVVAVTVKV